MAGVRGVDYIDEYGNRILTGGLKAKATNLKNNPNFYKELGKLSKAGWEKNGRKPRGVAYMAQHDSVRLKEVSANLFGLNYSELIGSNEDKNKNSPIKWESVYNLFNNKTKKTLSEVYDVNKEYMTNREWLEVYGSHICRKIKEDCHALSAYKKIKSLKSEIVINTDCRFENEFLLFEKDPDVLKIKLQRDEFNSPAESERGLDEIDLTRYDLVVNNKNLSVKEKNEIIIDFLISRDVLSRKNIKVD